MDTTSISWASGSTLAKFQNAGALGAWKRHGIRWGARAIQGFAGLMIAWCALPALVLFGLCLLPGLLVLGVLMLLRADVLEPERAPRATRHFSQKQHHPPLSGALPA